MSVSTESGREGRTSPLPTLVVPARLASTRFPRKLLQPVGGRPLIVAVGERLRAEVPEYPLVFAVDSGELAEPLHKAGFRAELTDPDHASGTDRIAEVAQRLGLGAVINVQGDEPMVARAHISLLTSLLERGEAPMVTLATPFPPEGNPDNPNEVKVVCNQQGKALYFSRSRIPFDREPGDPGPSRTFYRHLGLYGFAPGFVQLFAGLPVSPLEQREKLEQLRALDHGYPILVGITEQPSIGIDTPADLERFLARG